MLLHLRAGWHIATPAWGKGRRVRRVRAVRVEDLLEELDVVEYCTPAQPSSIRVGRVIKVVDSGHKVQLEPLVQDGSEEGDGDVFVAGDGSLLLVAVHDIVRVVAYDLSERQDTVSNPHGEHAHPVYRILQPLTRAQRDAAESP